LLKTNIYILTSLVEASQTYQLGMLMLNLFRPSKLTSPTHVGLGLTKLSWA